MLGDIGLALVRAAGDRLFGASPAWATVREQGKLLVDLLMATVGAGIGLRLALAPLVAAGARAGVVAAAPRCGGPVSRSP